MRGTHFLSILTTKAITPQNTITPTVSLVCVRPPSEIRVSRKGLVEKSRTPLLSNGVRTRSVIVSVRMGMTVGFQGLRRGLNRSILDVCEDLIHERNAEITCQTRS